jgi:hypothetical protein
MALADMSIQPGCDFGKGCGPATDVTSVISLLNRLIQLEIKHQKNEGNAVATQVTKLHAATTWAIILGFGKVAISVLVRY